MPCLSLGLHLTKINTQTMKTLTIQKAHPLFKSNKFLYDQSALTLQSIPYGDPHCHNDWRSIFFTGGTGFIGKFLLKELLENTDATIYCLVRSNGNHGIDSIKTSMQLRGFWRPEFDSRLQAVPGDLGLERLGVGIHWWKILREVDCIFHLGASVKWISGYSSEAKVNVGSLKEILELAADGKTKPVHYFSSMGTYASVLPSFGTIYEDEIFDDPEKLLGGYCQTKWVSEKIIEKARSLNIPVNLYRIGEVFGDSISGNCDPNNFVSHFISVCLRERSFPASYKEARLNLIPVDQLAKMILECAIRLEGNGKNFQFNGSEIFTLEEMAEEISRSGFCVKPVTGSDWNRITKKNVLSNKITGAIFKKITLCDGEMAFSLFDLGQNVFCRHHDTTNSDAILRDSKIDVARIIEDKILYKFISRIKE